MTDMSRARSTAFLVGLLILLAPLPFFSHFLNANNITRALLTQAIVEQGTTRIDPYNGLTTDKAFYEGHYYTDKAPGMSLMAIPAYAAGLALAGGSEALDFGPEEVETAEDNVPRMLTYRLMVLTTSGLLTALAGAAFYLFALRTTQAPVRSLLATLTVFLATPILGWSVNFFGHAAAGAVLFLGFFLLAGLVPGNRVILRAVGAGLLLGLAVVIEYTTVPAAALIACYGLWRLRAFGLGQALGIVGIGLLASFAAIVPLLIYHTVSFGGPLSTGYSNVVGFEGMETGFMGLTWPDPDVLLIRITVSRWRGIFWISPILAVAPWAIWVAWRAGWMRAELVTSIVIVLFFALLNASYFYWSGGGSMGPRHITPALPFLGVTMIWLWAQARGWGLSFLLGLLGLSIVLTLVCAATTMTPLASPFQIVSALGEVLHGETWFAWYRHVGVGQIPAVLIWLALVSIPASLLWRRMRTV